MVTKVSVKESKTTGNRKGTKEHEKGTVATATCVYQSSP